MRVHRSGARRPQSQQSSTHRKILDFNRTRSHSRPRETSDRIDKCDLAARRETAPSPLNPQPFFSSIAALYSASKSMPKSIPGSIWRNAAYMMDSRCRPENWPGKAFRLYF